MMTASMKSGDSSCSSSVTARLPTSISRLNPELLDNKSSAAQRFPFRAAVVFEGHAIQYWYLDREANRFANALASLGVLKGDRVVLLLPNIPQSAIAFYGTLRA